MSFLPSVVKTEMAREALHSVNAWRVTDGPRQVRETHHASLNLKPQHCSGPGLRINVDVPQTPLVTRCEG